MAVEVQDHDEDVKVFESGIAVTEENGQWVIRGPLNGILGVYPKEDVRRIEVLNPHI